MIRCCSLVDQLDTSHTLIIYFDNTWTRGWSFCDPFSWRWLHVRNVTQQNCDWSSIKPFTAGNFFSKLIFVITSLQLFAWFHFRHPFPIQSSSTNSVTAFFEKLDDKEWLKTSDSFKTHYIGLFFRYCLVLDSSTLSGIIGNTGRKTVIEVAYYRSNF